MNGRPQGDVAGIEVEPRDPLKRDLDGNRPRRLGDSEGENLLACWSAGLCRNFDVVDVARGRWKRKPIFAQALQMKLDSFAYLCFGLRDRRARCDTSR